MARLLTGRWLGCCVRAGAGRCWRAGAHARQQERLWQKRTRYSGRVDGCLSSGASTRSTLHAFRQISDEGGEIHGTAAAAAAEALGPGRALRVDRVDPLGPGSHRLFARGGFSALHTSTSPEMCFVVLNFAFVDVVMLSLTAASAQLVSQQEKCSIAAAGALAGIQLTRDCSQAAVGLAGAVMFSHIAGAYACFRVFPLAWC